MPKDWKEISADEMLNFDDAHTGTMARFDRIMQQKSIDTIDGLREKIVGLMETIYRASQALQEKADNLGKQIDQSSRSQVRQQNVLIALSIVVALSTVAYTWITWQSVVTLREANAIQLQLLGFQKSNGSAK